MRAAPAAREPGADFDHDRAAWRDRGRLAERVERVLHRGGPLNPDVLLVRAGAGRVVVKDFAPRSAWVRAAPARWITRRELRAHARLAGHPAVPRVLGTIDGLAFALEYRPGRMLTRSLAASLPPDFLSALAASVEELHARGVVHLDLRHRGNVLLGDDGRPVLLDFASAVCFRPGSLAARLILPLLARIDRRALEKWRARLSG